MILYITRLNMIKFHYKSTKNNQIIIIKNNKIYRTYIKNLLLNGYYHNNI